MKSIMIITDGNRDVDGVHRTFFEAWDGLYFSYLGRNWVGSGTYKRLPEVYENSNYSVADIKYLFNQRNSLYVFIDACKNGTTCMPPAWFYSIKMPEPDDNHYTEQEYFDSADMARAFGIYPNFTGHKLYMSWRGYALKGMSYWWDLTHYNDFLFSIWNSVGNTGSGNYKRFDQAISHAAIQVYGNRIPAANFSYIGNTATNFENY